jgi:hypothetical protein
MAIRSTPSFLQGGQHPAENVRLMVQSLLGGVTQTFAGGLDYDAAHGLGRAGDLAVTANSTPNMSVDVAPGGCFVRNTEDPDGGTYHCYSDATVNLPISASGADPRWDLIVVRVADSEYSGANDEAYLEVVEGTPGSPATDPVVPDNALVLARVVVAAGVSSITSGAITALASPARPWNSAWGVVADHSPANFTFNTSVGYSASTTWNQVEGRKYRVTVAGEVVTNGATGKVVSVGVAAGTSIIDSAVVRFTSRNDDDQWRAAGVITYTATGTGGLTWRLRAVSSASALNQTLSSGRLIIEDIGPA